MNCNDVKQFLLRSADLAGLDEDAAAALFLRGKVEILENGESVYEEGAILDGTFCLLLEGNLVVKQSAETVGVISEEQVFGEMAYFTNRRARTANVRVATPHAVFVRFQLTEKELNSARFSTLKNLLGLQTWPQFVCSAQSGLALANGVL